VKLRKNVLMLLLVAVLFFGAVIISRYPTVQQRLRTLKGVSFSPKGFQSADLTDFFENAKKTGDIVSWAGDWDEIANTQNGGPTVVASLAFTYGYVPVIETQFFLPSSGRLLRPLNESNRQNYKDSAVAFAEKYEPKYLAFGIEVNMLYEKSPADFDAFVDFYSEVYDAVKAKSPYTKVFTVFQLEKTKGLSGGLFGGSNDPANAQWSLIDKFPKSDIIAFTTYPGLIYSNPSDIPSDYYSEIKFHTSKTIAFTEIGWHSGAAPYGWESSDSEQAKFITTFFNLTKDLSMEFVIWSFMYDQDTFEPFNSMGLRRREDGSAKPAWIAWIDAN